MRIAAVDLGGTKDPTALVRTQDHAVIAADRLPLGTTYDKQLPWLRGLLSQNDVLLLDAGGVGRPLFDMLGPQRNVYGIMSTNGREVVATGRLLKVPKSLLFGSIPMALRTKQLEIAVKSHELYEEMQKITLVETDNGPIVKVSRKGGNHGDLCAALAMGTWFRLCWLPRTV